MLRCVSIAPLETPVVPPVYCRNAMSSRFTVDRLERRRRRRAPAPSRSVMAPSIRHAGTIFFTCLMTRLTIQRFGAGSRSPSWVVITCSIGVFREHLLQNAGEVLENDDGLGAGVLQLVLELARRVQRIDVHHGHAGAQHAEQRHRILQEVRRHDGDALALAHSRQALEESGEVAGQPVQLGIADACSRGCGRPACRRTCRRSARTFPARTRTDRGRSRRACRRDSS